MREQEPKARSLTYPNTKQQLFLAQKQAIRGFILVSNSSIILLSYITG